MNNYKKIKYLLNKTILLEEQENIQKMMIQLSKTHDIEAMKLLYLIIREQKITYKNEQAYLKTLLDYQDDYDKTNICINLANNTVKQSYRLLDWIINSFYIDPNLKDEQNCTMYGYLMANLIGIYKSNNNFHSRQDLEKVMVKLSKKICRLYYIDINGICYQTSKGKEKNYLELIEQYRMKNCDLLNKMHTYGTMDEILKEISDENKSVENLLEEHTMIRDFSTYDQVERFSKQKRYTKRTLDFATKILIDK